MSAAEVARLYRHVTGEAPGHIDVRGGGAVYPGRFRVAELATACVGALTAAAAGLHRDRGGNPGPVGVDVRHAAVSFRSERYLRVDGRPPGEIWSPLSGDYRSADGWVKLHCNYPHHARAACTALGVADDREAVAAEVARRTAWDVQETVIAAGGVAAAMRTREQWLAHPAGQALAGIELVGIDRIDDAPARPLPAGTRPLSGVRVLDLTHVIAGPVCGRVLAAHGADVLHVGAQHLPTVRPLVIDTGFGKRSTHLDLRDESALGTLRALIADADVLVQSYRPGSLAARGLGPGQLPRGVLASWW